MSQDRDHERRQELFNEAQRLASVGGWEYNIESDQLYWTKELHRVHELPVEYKPTLKEAIEFFHPADQPEIRSAIKQATDGEAFEDEWRLETAEGDRRWVRVHGKPHREEGTVVRLQGAIVDITDRKQHKKRLNTLFETSRDLLRTDSTEEIATLGVEAAREILGLSVNGVYLYSDERDALVSVATTQKADDTINENPSFEPGESVAWTAFESGEPQVYADVRTATNVYNSETAIRSEFAMPLGDHGVFLASSTESNAFDERTLSLANILAADIETALNQITHETELRETTERLRAIFQHTPDALFVFDGDGQVVDANDQAYESLGYDSDNSEDCAALLGKHWSTFRTVTDDSEPTRDSDPLADVCENPESAVTVEAQHTRQDGSTFPVRIRIAHIDHDGDGDFLAIARDVSEITAQQRQLRRQNEQLEQFASVISHDLRSPLSVAQAGVEVARRMGEGHGDSLDRASQAHERMNTLIENLLQLARNGQTIAENDLEHVELAALVKRSWQTVATEDATLSVEGEYQLIADESRLRQLVENLLRNSIDHGGDELTIRVGTLSDGFYIEDNGSGIAEEKREQIFQPGYTTADDGTGYGLDIVSKVVEAHGWEITVIDSETGGARFEIAGLDQNR